MQMHTRGVRDDPVGDPTEQVTLHHVILTVAPPAGHDIIPFIKLGEQAGNIGRIILQVGVDGNNDTALRMIESRHHGGGLTEITREIDDLDPGIALREGRQNFGRAIGAAVIHHDDFKRNTGLIEDGDDLFDKQRQRCFFVINGYHHRDEVFSRQSPAP